MVSPPANSLLLLAVKRAINIGNAKIYIQHQRFYSNTDYSTYEVSAEDVPGFLNALVDQSFNNLPESLKKHKAELIDTHVTWDGLKYEMCCNTFYAVNKGRLYFFTYCFQPKDDLKSIQAETLSFEITCRLAATCICSTLMQRTSMGHRKFDEKRYIKPAVTNKDFIDALTLAVSPLLGSFDIKTPSNIGYELQAQAFETPSTIPSDAPRRTVYNKYKQMSVVVTDPAVLKLLPSRWEYVSTKVIIRNNGYVFEY